MCPLEEPPLGVRLEDVDSRMLRGCLEGVPWCDGFFHSGGVEVWGCPAAELEFQHPFLKYGDASSNCVSYQALVW